MKATSKLIIIRLLKTSEKIENLKSSQGKKGQGPDVFCTQGQRQGWTSDFSLTAVQVTRQWNSSFTAQTEKPPTEFHSKNTLQTRRQGEGVFTHTNPGRMHHQLTCTTRNVKGHTYFKQIKNGVSWKPELHKGMKIKKWYYTDKH